MPATNFLIGAGTALRDFALAGGAEQRRQGLMLENLPVFLVVLTAAAMALVRLNV